MRLDDLFRVTDNFTLPNGEVIAIRVLSDPELKVRDEEAAKAASLVAREFADKDSDLYRDNVLPLEDADDETLRSLLVSIRETEFRLEVMATIRPQVIPLPDDATPEEVESVEQHRDEEMERVNEMREKHVKAVTAPYRESLEKMTRKQLLKRVSPAVSIPFSMSARQEAFISWTVHLSTERALAMDTVRNMHPKVKAVLYRKYREVDSVDPFDFRSSS